MAACRATFVWNGPVALRLIQAAQREGLEARAKIVEAELRATLHRESGEMAENAYARVEERGGRLVLVAGSTAEHTVYHELGTSRQPAHPQIRATMDRNAREVPKDIAKAVARRAGAFARRGGR